MKICTYLSARRALDVEMNGLRLEYEKRFQAEFPPGLADPLAVERRYRAYFLRRDFHNILMREWVIGIRELCLALFQKSQHKRHLDRVNTVRWKQRKGEINSLIRDSPLAKPMGRPRKKPKKTTPKKPAKKLTRMERYWRDKGGEQNRERAKRGTGTRPKPDYWAYQAAIVAWHLSHVPPEPLRTGSEAARNVLRDRGRAKYLRFLKKEMGRK